MSKPENWDVMTREEQVKYAKELLDTFRGRFIIGQALYNAAEVMSKAEYPEVSNIEDMEVLSTLFVTIPTKSDAPDISQFARNAAGQYEKDRGDSGVKV